MRFVWASARSGVAAVLAICGLGQPGTSVAATAALSAAVPHLEAQARLQMLGFEGRGEEFVRAIAARHSQMVELFLASGIDVNSRDESGRSALFAAIASNQLDLARRLLSAGADPKVADDAGRTSLMAAGLVGDESLVKAMLDAGADASAVDERGHAALHFALMRKDKALVQLLIDAAPLPTKQCDDGDILAHALQTNDWSFVEPVLQRLPSKVRWCTGTRAWLGEALRKRDAGRLRLLLSKHEGPATLDGRKQPLLAYAIATGNTDVLQMLLDCGADPNCPIESPAEKSFLELIPATTVRHYLEEEPGMNVLMLAAGLGRADYVKLLLDRGANRFTATTSKYKLVPLYFAAWAQSPESIQTLLGNAPSPDVMRVEISIGSQRATLMKNGIPVLTTNVSTGRSGFSTPEGKFVVTDKHPLHMSTIYKVKMPFFMRLSCREFGMHEGYAEAPFASHGCIRLPADAAKRLFQEVPIGTLVTIAR